MSLKDIKNKILFEYHKDINYWYKLLGEFYENTECFTDAYTKRCHLDGKLCEITWSTHWDWELLEV